MFEKTCTRLVHRFKNLCTRQPKCAHRLQGAPLISNTARFIVVNIKILLVLYLNNLQKIGTDF